MGDKFADMFEIETFHKTCHDMTLNLQTPRLYWKSLL